MPPIDQRWDRYKSFRFNSRHQDRTSSPSPAKLPQGVGINYVSPDMDVRLASVGTGAAREIQEGIAVDPLLVGCGVKPHDFDSPRQDGQRWDMHNSID